MVIGLQKAKLLHRLQKTTSSSIENRDIGLYYHQSSVEVKSNLLRKIKYTDFSLNNRLPVLGLTHSLQLLDTATTLVISSEKLLQKLQPFSSQEA